jgi:CRP-like cAMP-binding protein
MKIFRRAEPASHLRVAGFDDAELAALTGRNTVIDLAEGTFLCRQGRTGTELFVLLEGSAVVSRNGETVSTVSVGDVVGEMSLLGDRVFRNADVVATTPLTVAVVSSKEWRSAVRQTPSLATKMRALADARA